MTREQVIDQHFERTILPKLIAAGFQKLESHRLSFSHRIGKGEHFWLDVRPTGFSSIAIDLIWADCELGFSEDEFHEEFRKFVQVIDENNLSISIRDDRGYDMPGDCLNFDQMTPWFMRQRFALWESDEQFERLPLTNCLNYASTH